MYVIIMCMCRALSEQKHACVKKMEYSESESESDHVVSTMTSRLETGSGQVSNAASTILEMSLDALASTVSSLLALLRSPMTFRLGTKETRII